jgi:hypothetical protein
MPLGLKKGFQNCNFVNKRIGKICDMHMHDMNMPKSKIWDVTNLTPDEDIPTTQPSPPTVDDPIVTAQDKSNDEIRIVPIT